jgi:hypothetical protein
LLSIEEQIQQKIAQRKNAAAHPAQPVQPPKGDILAEVITRWPVMKDAGVRSLVRTLCKTCGFPFTPDGVYRLEIYYNQAGYKLWDFIENKIAVQVPAGMISGAFIAGRSSGDAISSERII